MATLKKVSLASYALVSACPVLAAGDSAAEGGHGAHAGNAAIGYATLYDALGRSLSQERAVLLLYILLHSSPHFHEYCLVSWRSARGQTWCWPVCARSTVVPLRCLLHLR